MERYSQADVWFDKYLETSLKDGTCSDWAELLRPIREVIHSRHVRLPQTWKQLINHSKKKAELASFLSNELMMSAKVLSEGQDLIIACGFDDAD